MTEMSIDSLRNNLSNPARVYLWEVIMPNPLEGDTETLLLRAQTTALPERSFGSILIPFKQTGGVKYPGKITYTHALDITFIEGEDRAILETFYNMMEDIISSKTGIGTLSYKRDFYIHLINQDGSVAKRIKLVGTYAERMSGVEMNHESETPMTFTITFSFDRWEPV
jgi:hypothetical protein